MALERLATASPASTPPAGGARQCRSMTQVLPPTANRPLPQTRGLGHRLDPAVTQCECCAGGPAATSTFIQCRRKAGELSSQDFSHVTVYHVIKGVQAHKIGQLFIYDDKTSVAQLTSCSEFWGQWLCAVHDSQYIDLICLDAVNNPIGSFDHLPDVRCFILRHHAS